MSRRDYDRYDEYSPPRRARSRLPPGGYEETDALEVDVRHTHGRSRSRRPETIVKERDTVITDRRNSRPVPDFLREDYGRGERGSGQLVLREEVVRDRRDSDAVESFVSRGPRVVREERIVIDERESGERVLPYPRSRASEVGSGGRGEREEEIVIRERARSRGPPVVREGRGSKEEIDITIRRDEAERRAPPVVRERDVEEVRVRRGTGERPVRMVEREEIDIRETRRASPPRRAVEEKEIDIKIRERESSPRGRGREVVQEEIDIRETSRPARRRSPSRGVVVAKKEEEWIVRRPRTPPPRDFETEEIIIRRKERTPSPEPVREPTPEPVPPPMEPIYRPPIIQEVITHHRHIDHGFERARTPTPPPPPSPPTPPPREENLEIEIKRKGIRNGKAFEEDLIIEKDLRERERERDREVVEEEKRVVAIDTRRRSPSRRRYYEDDYAEIDYYRRRAPSRSYPIAPIPPPPREEVKEEIKITETRVERDRPRRRERDNRWTEITKDLVIKEAIEERGYEYDETADHFYVQEYLRYEDVLRLVEITEEIKRERHNRIREIRIEREREAARPKMLPAPIPPPPRGRYDETIRERDYYIERDGRRYR